MIGPEIGSETQGSDTTTDLRWPWNLLTSPTTFPDGDRGFDPWVRARLLKRIDEVVDCLRVLLEVRIATSWNSSHSTVNALEIPFAVAIQCGTPPSQVILGVHQDAARLLVQRLGHRMVGLRLSGQVSPEEIGLLEFLVLEVVDRLLSFDSSFPHLQLTGFMQGRELFGLVANQNLVPTTVDLVVAGQTGNLTVWVPAHKRSVNWHRKLAIGKSPAPTHVSCSLALPELRLARADLAKAKAGDVLLLGYGSLKACTGQLRMVTRTGWQLGRVDLVCDRPGWLRWKMRDFDPQPLVLAGGDPASELVLPLMGNLEISLLEMSGLRPGKEFEAIKEPCPVSIWGDHGKLWEGELGLLDGELAVALLEGP